jgi:hypothetical protein
VRTRSDAQVIVGFRQPQLVEEQRRHPLVEMLAGMNKPRFKVRPAARGVENRRDLHEIRPRSNHTGDMHVSRDAAGLRRTQFYTFW